MMKNMMSILLTIGLLHFSAYAQNNNVDTKSATIHFDNAYFYDENGTFLPEKAKDAILNLMDYHGYPTYEGIRDDLWVMDYNAGRFAEVGLSGITYENNQKNLYMLLDIFLLPNQMLAEHWHVDGEETAAKREGWLVRWGKSYIVGVGVDNMSQFPQVKVPKVHWDGNVAAKHVVEGLPGTFTNLQEVLSKHWQMAGDKGAIITEVANFADGKAVKRSDPKMN